MQLSIRPTTLEDYEAVCRLFEEGDDFHRQALPGLFRQALPARTYEFFKSYLNNDQAHLWVADTSTHLIGLVEFHVVVIPDRPNTFPRTFIFVDSLIVQESARRQGVGQALMEKVRDWTQEHGLSKIELNVHEFNQGAIEFYQKLGYATISRRMNKRVD